MPSASARRCASDDYITSTHRGHGHCLAKGATPDLMFAELLGKEAGYCKGKGGSMHIADPATGNLGANAIVGGSAGIATGAAFSSKYPEERPRRGLLLRRGRARPGPALRGDEPARSCGSCRSSSSARTTATTSTRTSPNRRPATSRRAPRRSASPPRPSTARTCARSTQTASKYIERARRGEGPAFLQCITYRYHGHHVGDIARAYYRPKAEEQEWVTQKDPVTLHGEWLMANGVADRAALDAIQEELIAEMDAAVEFAVNASYPDPSKVTEDIYA